MDTEQRENLDADVVTPAADAEQAPVEMTPEDVEAEEEFSLKEEEWQQRLERFIKEWKNNASSVVRGTGNPEQAKRDIGHINEAAMTLEDVRMFHAFEQVEKSGSVFYKEQFRKLVDGKLEELSGQYENPSFCLARLLKTLREKSTTEMKDAA